MWCEGGVEVCMWYGEVYMQCGGVCVWCAYGVEVCACGVEVRMWCGFVHVVWRCTCGVEACPAI